MKFLECKTTSTECVVQAANMLLHFDDQSRLLDVIHDCLTSCFVYKESDPDLSDDSDGKCQPPYAHFACSLSIRSLLQEHILLESKLVMLTSCFGWSLQAET